MNDKDLIERLLRDRAKDPRVCGSPEMELRWKAADRLKKHVAVAEAARKAYEKHKGQSARMVILGKKLVALDDQ